MLVITMSQTSFSVRKSPALTERATHNKVKLLKGKVTDTLANLEERLFVGLPRLTHNVTSINYKIGLASTRILEHSKALYDLSSRSEDLKRDLSALASVATELSEDLKRASESDKLTEKPKFRVVKGADRSKIIEQLKLLNKDEFVTDAELKRLVHHNSLSLSSIEPVQTQSFIAEVASAGSSFLEEPSARVKPSKRARHG
jgi:hypothetical protein